MEELVEFRWGHRARRIYGMVRRLPRSSRDIYTVRLDPKPFRQHRARAQAVIMSGQRSLGGIIECRRAFQWLCRSDKAMFIRGHVSCLPRF